MVDALAQPPRIEWLEPPTQIHGSTGLRRFRRAQPPTFGLGDVGLPRAPEHNCRAADRRVSRSGSPGPVARPRCDGADVQQTALHGPYARGRRGADDWRAVRRWVLGDASGSLSRREPAGTTAARIRCRRVDVGIREDMAHGLPGGKGRQRAGTRGVLVRAGRCGSTGGASVPLVSRLVTDNIAPTSLARTAKFVNPASISWTVSGGAARRPDAGVSNVDEGVPSRRPARMDSGQIRRDRLGAAVVSRMISWGDSATRSGRGLSGLTTCCSKAKQSCPSPTKSSRTVVKGGA